MPDRLRQIIIAVAGVAALVYALWPPLEFEYLGVAAAILGIEPLAQGYAGAKLREPTAEDKAAFDHWLDGRDRVRGHDTK